MRSLFVFLMCFAVSSAVFAQGIPAPTVPLPKTIVLEEFTGMYCQHCPGGHKIAKEISDQYPGRVSLVNIHVGSLATPQGSDPDFRTSFGNAYASEAGVSGIPSGVVNRMTFNGATSTAMSRGSWAAAAAQVLGENSYVNLGVEAEVDVQTREITVDVQLAYTGTAPASNNITVMLIQNNIEGPQRDFNGQGVPYYPEGFLENGNYNHVHMLKHVITPQWGEVVTAVPAGQTIDKQYTYTIPADVNGIPIELGNVQIVAFVDEGRSNIQQGYTITPEFTNFQYALDASVKSSIPTGDNSLQSFCGFTTAPIITIANDGGTELTDLVIEYSVNGSPIKTQNWSGSIPVLKSATVQLNAINFFPAATNTLEVTVKNPNNGSDENAANDVLTATFGSPNTSTNVTMTLQLDYYGSEVTWELRNSAGTVLYSGGPYADVADPQSQPPFPAPIVENFTLTDGDCYEFVMDDSFGDGLLGGTTGYTLEDDNNVSILSSFRDFTSNAKAQFGVNAPAPDSSDVISSIRNIGLEGVTADVFPNPASGSLNVSIVSNRSALGTVTMLDLNGKEVFATELNLTTGTTNSKINLSGMASGMYFVKTQVDNGVSVQRVIVE